MPSFAEGPYRYAKRRSWRLLAIALSVLALGGCGVSEREFHAGQTGSLTCDVLTRGAQLPSGDVAGIADAEDCPVEAGDVVVLDADGRSLPVVLEPLDDGRYLIRADEALTPGTYQVKLHDQHAELVVDEVAALPERLGEIESIMSECDLAVIRLQLTEDAQAYASLIRLKVSVAGAPPQLSVDVGALRPDADGVATLSVERCVEGSCWATGDNTLAITAEIVGETLELPPLQGSFEETCSFEEDELTCAVQQQNGERRIGPLWILGVFGVGLWLRRTRGSRPSTINPI